MKSKKFNIFFLFFYICSNFCELNIQWNNITQESENGSFSINCSYQTDDYIILNEIQATAMPNSDFMSVVFLNQPYELITSKKDSSTLLLHGKGEIAFVSSTKEPTVSSVLVNYSEYDIKTNKIKKDLSLEVFPNFSIKDSAELTDKKITDEIENKTILSELSNESIPDNIYLNENSQEETDKSKNNFTNKIINYMKIIDNFALFCFIVFFLGILMNLTPCMYPMFPITLGILGIDSSQTNRREVFLKATSYALGIALTFSILGLFVVSGNLIFGGLFSKRWFLYLITLVFGSMTLNMLGFYEFSIPIIQVNKYLPSNKYLYSFLYGIISGTVTSPCISPGVFALLTIIAEKQDLFLGAIYLFLFGLGLAFPLWIFAIFFRNILILPKSGMWMVSVKQFIGLILLLVWSSYVKLLFGTEFSAIITLIILALFIIKNKSIFDFKKRSAMNIVLLIIIIGIFSYFSKSLFDSFRPKEKTFIENEYHIDYSIALSEAISQGKFLFMDVFADSCSICKLIEKKHLNNEYFVEALKDSFVLLKINLSNYKGEKADDLIKKYNVKGLPSIFVINPKNESIIRQFDGEVIDLSTEEFFNQINNYI